MFHLFSVHLDPVAFGSKAVETLIELSLAKKKGMEIFKQDHFQIDSCAIGNPDVHHPVKNKLLVLKYVWS